MLWESEHRLYSNWEVELSEESSFLKEKDVYPGPEDYLFIFSLLLWEFSLWVVEGTWYPLFKLKEVFKSTLIFF